MRKLGITALCLLAIYGLARAADVENPFRPPAITCSSQFIRSIAALTGVGTCATVDNASLATMSASTIKGQIVGGSGVPVDLTAAQAAAVIATTGGATINKLVSFTRDLTAASGDVAYTGFGFTPTSCFFNGGVTGSTAYTAFAGMSDSSKAGASTYVASTGTFSNVATQIVLVFQDATGALQQRAIVKTYDADGLTLTWTKTSTPTGTAGVNIMCQR